MNRSHLSRRGLLAGLALTAVTQPALPQTVERRIMVNFDSEGATSLEGTISEFEVAVYVVPLQQGQSLAVALATSNTFNCFDIHAPGAPKPLYVGADSGNTHVLRANEPGDYLVKVFLLRLAARDGQSANYTLELRRSGQSKPDRP